MMMKSVVLTMAAAAGFAAFAQSASRENFVQRQAFEEVQRVAGQVDVLQSNLDDLSGRIDKLERKGDGGDLRQELADVRAQIEALRREMQTQRETIVRDLLKRIDSARPASAPKTPSMPKSVKVYKVQSGDTLSVIADAFGTTVAKLKEMNGLKSDILRIGQELRVPAGK